MAHDEVFDEILDGPPEIQIAFLNQYIEDNFEELTMESNLEYLAELYALIETIKEQHQNVLTFPKLH